MSSHLLMQRFFTSPDVDPYSTVQWAETDIRILNWRDGSVNFAQDQCEFPVSWSDNARQIVASKYFRGKQGSPTREYSLKQVIDRVVNTYTQQGIEHGYFLEPSAKVFRDELKFMLVHQMFAFNSPVWFNIGTSAPQQVSACFLLSVEDDMHKILDWYKEEGLIFKGGSGAGVNLSNIRSSKEQLSSGGFASGPVSFMRGADASAGTIKSGGSTRRAAKLVCLDVDHPDIEEFIEVKAQEERKIRALRDAGFDMDLGGKDSNSVQYQNANNSVRVSDEFMRAVENDELFALKSRTTGQTIEKVNARDLFGKMALAAWECADPGIQYDDTINSWHTCPADGKIETSNPCSEYMHLSNSSCNLASLNLMRFVDADGLFDSSKFVAAVRMIITAMDISVSFADFPTEKITDVSRRYRQLGIGYANLGALLMSMGLAYDSPEGRGVAASITSLMSATAWAQSADLARVVGPYEGFSRNAEPHCAVIDRHAKESERATSHGADDLIWESADSMWKTARLAGGANGFRNAQVSLIAPTGTISFMMDCDTTGIEPDFALVKYKKLHGGADMKIVNNTVRGALVSLGYQQSEEDEIVSFIAENGHVVGAPGLDPAHYAVFDCAVGERYIDPMGHVKMMAAVQPFLCGAISKTINLPESATVDEIKDVYFSGWQMGLKAMAVYRDNCKAHQPLSNKKKVENPAAQPAPIRHHMPRRRESLTTAFNVGGAPGYLTSALIPGNGPGEMFLKFGKQGSTLSGVLDGFAIAISLGLQHGVPLEVYAEKFIGMQFEPRGMTDDKEIPFASSLLDYVFKRLILDYASPEQRATLGVASTQEREATLADNVEYVKPQPTVSTGWKPDAPLCLNCGSAMQRSGVCWACNGCGATSGCS